MSSAAPATDTATSGAAPKRPAPVFDDRDIAITVDLIDAARHQLAFLKEIDSRPSLYSGPVVKNAVRRYETCWLPLVAEHKGPEIAPPQDVHWVWHVHMLAPYYYEKDCMRIVNTVPDHRLMSPNSREAAMERAREIWSEKYKSEPFDIPLDKDTSSSATCNGFHEPYQKKSAYDIESAAARQRMFYYQVSLPHYRDGQFLRNAILRYKKYLFLKNHNMEMFLVPCYDFDLVWHSHQLHPHIYKQNTQAILGRMFNHDDSVIDRGTDSKLVRSDCKTRQLWRETFNEDFALCGAMFRGEPPSRKLHKVSHDQVFSVSSKKADVTISNLKVENLVQEDQKFTLKVALAGRLQTGITLLKLKGPQKEWDNNGKGIKKFTFDTGHHSLLQFDLVDKKGFLCFGTNQSYGIHNYPFSQVVEATPADGQTVSQTLPLLEGGTGPTNGLSVAFTANVGAPQKGPCILVLQAGPFQPYTMPENIEQLWGPISLPRLPEGVPNTCIVASHRYGVFTYFFLVFFS